MALIEQVTQMKNQGMDESQISENLQQQGFAPREVQDALGQSQVKNAVMGNEPQEAQSVPQESYSPQQEQYAPQENYSQEGYAPQAGGYPEAEGYGNYPAVQTGGTDNMIEISEQVFSEKIKKVDKNIHDLVEFKTLAGTKIDLFEDRIKRIEAMIDNLQIKVLEKIGSYGKELAKTKKEVAMVEDSFGKMVNRIADKPLRKKVHKKRK